MCVIVMMKIHTGIEVVSVLQVSMKKFNVQTISQLLLMKC
jgi:hypothetical protein